MVGRDVREELAAKGLSFGKETFVEVPERDRGDEHVYAVCVQTDDVSLLISKKVYRIRPCGNRVWVKDENGEAALYPADHFLILALSQSAEQTLGGVFGPTANTWETQRI